MAECSRLSHWGHAGAAAARRAQVFVTLHGEGSTDEVQLSHDSGGPFHKGALDSFVLRALDDVGIVRALTVAKAITRDNGWE